MLPAHQLRVCTVSPLNPPVEVLSIADVAWLGRYGVMSLPQLGDAEDRAEDRLDDPRDADRDEQCGDLVRDEDPDPEADERPEAENQERQREGAPDLRVGERGMALRGQQEPRPSRRTHQRQHRIHRPDDQQRDDLRA